MMAKAASRGVLLSLDRLMTCRAQLTRDDSAVGTDIPGNERPL